MNAFLLYFLLFLVLIVIKFIRPELGSILYEWIYGKGDVLIFDRVDEMVKSSSSFSTSELLVNHIYLIAPSLILSSFILSLLYFRVNFIKALLRLLSFTIILIVFGLIVLSPIQSLICFLPIVTTHIFSICFFKDLYILDRVIVWGLLTSVQVVFSVYVLSILKWITPEGFLSVSLIFLLLSLFCIWKFYKVSFLKNDVKVFLNLEICFYRLVEKNRLIRCFSGFMIFSIFWRICSIIYYPPNNVDGMTYHLSRIAYWLQQGSLEVFYTHNFRQVNFPMNSEILMMWTMLSSRQDYLCGFIQFIAYIFVGILIYRVTRIFLKADALTSLFICLLWLSLPAVVLESTNVKNNIVVTFYLLTHLYFFFLGGRSIIFKSFFCLSSVSLAMAIGTKVTALPYTAPFLFLFFMMWIRGGLELSKIKFWFTSFAFFTFFLGAYSYIQNYLIFNNFLLTARVTKDMKSIQIYLSTISQHVYNLIFNQTGIQYYFSIGAEYYNFVTAWIGKIIFKSFFIVPNLSFPIPLVPDLHFGEPFTFNSWLNKIIIHEDFSFFGIAGPILIIVCFGILVRIIKQRKFFSWKDEGFQSFSTVLIVMFIVLLSIAKFWDPWAGRYMIVMFGLGMPNFVWLLGKKSTQRRALRNVLGVYYILILIPLTFMNQVKPLVPYKSQHVALMYESNYPGGWLPLFSNRDRLGLRTIVAPYTERFVRNFQNSVHQKAHVGLYLGHDTRDYYLFGEKLQRTIVPINKLILLSENFEYLVISHHLLEKNKPLYDLVHKKYVKFKYLGRDFSSEKTYLFIPKQS